MAMYALAIRPLIDRLQSLCPTVKQVWYADDATVAATCSELRVWWDTLVALGQDFGYHPNVIKTHLIVKKQFFDKAKCLFEGTNVNITVQGKRHLGAAIGSREYTEQYVGDKVKTWTQEVVQLAEIRYKFLKFEVHKKSASLVPIFKWSWNESTTFMCQECS